jgi:hypothetical protein
MIDPLGKILTEIRDNSGVAALTTRVRGGEPMGKTINSSGVTTDEGDARGSGKYVRFVVLTRLGSQRLKRAPVQEVRILAKCYGTTFQDAAALAGAVSDSIHATGHRINSSGMAIFGSFDDIGQGAEKDPDTGQPMESLIIQVGALTEALP